jgi:AcrR family transcriptional regulator
MLVPNLSRVKMRPEKRSVPAKKPKRSYHHGDLRKALLEAALKLIREQGVSGLTLREVARKVGVTHAAPYHHFATRELLLEALAEQGFVALARTMTLAIADAPSPGERLFALGRAYIDFARAHPERLQVMFRRRDSAALEAVAPERDTPVEGAAFAHLFEAVVACQAAAEAPPGDPHDLALAAWCVVHGFSKLWIEGPLDDMPPYEHRFAELRDRTLRDFVSSWAARARQAG